MDTKTPTQPSPQYLDSTREITVTVSYALLSPSLVYPPTCPRSLPGRCPPSVPPACAATTRVRRPPHHPRPRPSPHHLPTLSAPPRPIPALHTGLAKRWPSCPRRAPPPPKRRWGPSPASIGHGRGWLGWFGRVGGGNWHVERAAGQ